MDEQQRDMMKKLNNLEFALNESSIVAFTDKTGVITFANDLFCETSQYSLEELIGSYQNIVNSGYHPKEFFKEMWQTIGNGQVWRGEIKNKAKDGTYYWVDTTIVPFLDDEGKPYEYISIRHDITKRIEYEEMLKKVAYYDTLTELPNRNMLEKWVESRVDVKEEVFTAGLVLDIDRFKAINDNFGYDTGNMILKNVAKRLRNMLSINDLVIRESADKFIVFLSDIHSKEDVSKRVSQMKERLSIPFDIYKEKLNISFSIGISMEMIHYGKETVIAELENLIKEADTAMYYAKEQFGISHCYNTDDQNVILKRYRELELGLRGALSKDEFFIVYQPIVDLKENKINGVEALLRWQHPELGEVSPVEFIPVLEEIGLINPVGNWVLQSVVRQMKAWHEEGMMIERASINVSPVQFRNPDFISDLRKILMTEDLDPKFIDLEVTEGTILDIYGSKEILNELRDLGVYVSIDDFGTGYSSLSYLKKLPITTIKIDRSFIADLDKQDEMIVNTIIDLGENLYFNIVAEGVETEEQLKYLRQQNCYEGQGYYWSKPVQAKEINNLYASLNDSI